MTQMKRRSRVVVRILCASALLWGVFEATAQDKAKALSAADAGRKNYISYCTRCHGVDMVTNGSTFDLRTLRAEDKERFMRSVTKGLRAMPAWEGTLQSTDIDAIWSYLGSINGWAPAP